MSAYPTWVHLPAKTTETALRFAQLSQSGSKTGRPHAQNQQQEQWQRQQHGRCGGGGGGPWVHVHRPAGEVEPAVPGDVAGRCEHHSQKRRLDRDVEQQRLTRGAAGPPTPRWRKNGERLGDFFSQAKLRGRSDTCVVEGFASARPGSGHLESAATASYKSFIAYERTR